MTAKAIQALALLALSTLASAQVPVISGTMTVNDFALQCQHWGMKSNPKARGDACLAWLTSSVEAVGMANRTPECWDDLKANAAPMVVADVLFHMATLPDDKKMRLPIATREAILVAAKRCR